MPNGHFKRDSLGSLISSAGESIYEDASEGEDEDSPLPENSFDSLNSTHHLDRKSSPDLVAIRSATLTLASSPPRFNPPLPFTQF